MKTKEYSNYIIVNVKDFDEHAQNRVGRVIGKIYPTDEGDGIWMEYVFDKDAPYKKRFRVRGANIKRNFFTGTVTVYSANGSYTLRKATSGEVKHAEVLCARDRDYEIVKNVYGDDIFFMAPELIAEIARGLRSEGRGYQLGYLA